MNAMKKTGNAIVNKVSLEDDAINVNCLDIIWNLESVDVSSNTFN